MPQGDPRARADAGRSPATPPAPPARSPRPATRTQAAIAPPLAAEIYGLEILADDVEDEEHNTTRFVVLSRDFVQAPAGNGPVVTSFIFNVRNLPAALYKALGGFATNGVNMTKLESYMVGGEFTATQFLAEVDGHPDDPGAAPTPSRSWPSSPPTSRSSASTRPTRSAPEPARLRGRPRAV